MRLVVDTNVLVSALLSGGSLPAHLITLWRQGRFVLLTAAEQLDEFRRVTRYPRLRERLAPQLAGRLVNDLRAIAVVVPRLPQVSVSADPDDDFLLAIAMAGTADFLVTGDKNGLLVLRRHAGITIVTVREYLALQRSLP